MKRLSTFLTLCLLCILFTSCLNAESRNISAEETNHISADELIYGINNPDKHIPQKPPSPITPQKKVSKLNNSTHQEMLVIYNHLEMSQDQILYFEDQFHKEVKNPNQFILSQIEIQEIMNASFEIVLSEEQFHKYNDWRITGAK